MTDEAQKDILQAILRDDPKAFDRATGKNKHLYLGRFSLLAVCYLYGSRKIISAYADAMRRGNPQRLGEERKIYRDFAQAAGKALRLWAGYEYQDVHPLEMLAILGDWHTLRREYPTYVLSESEQTRLLSAIKLRYRVTAKIEGKQLILPPKPVAARTRYTLIAFAAFAALLILSSVALLAVSLVYADGIPVSRAADLMAAEDGKQYVLRSDLTLDEPIAFGTAHIDGAGHTLTVYASDVPAFSSFAGTVENCTVRIVGKNIAVSESYACLGLVNRGTWRHVRFAFEGEEGWTISLTGFTRGEDEQAVACKFGALFVDNEGTMDGCTISGDLNWVGQGEVDGELGAFASANTGTITGCRLEGNLIADTIDLGGVVFRNEASGVVDDCTIAEGVVVRQTTPVYLWSPKTGGIAAVNYGKVSNCTVLGTVAAVKENVVYPEDEQIRVSMISVGGIVSNNYGTIFHSAMAGEVQAYGEYTAVYVGGVCADNYYDEATNEQVALLDCNVVAGKVYGAGYYTYLGGLVGASSGYLKGNCFNGTINYSSGLSAAIYAGSVLGYGNFSDEDAPELFVDNHVVRLYYQTIYGTASLPVVGYYVQAGASVSSLVGVADHDVLDFSTLEAYWYGK